MKRKPIPQSTAPLIPIGTRVRLKEHLLWKDTSGFVEGEQDGKSVVRLTHWANGKSCSPFYAHATGEQVEIL